MRKAHVWAELWKWSNLYRNIRLFAIYYIFSALSHGAIFLAACNAIVLLRDVNL